MDEGPNFHMTIVREKRRSRHHSAPEDAEKSPGSSADQTAGAGAHRESHRSRAEGSEVPRSQTRRSGTHRSHSGRSGSHRSRHYDDYGTVDLGRMPSASEADPAPARTGGSEHREFVEKYTPVLNRKYQCSETGARRWILIVFAILIALVLAFFVFLRSPAETDAVPDVETLPVIDINEMG